MNIKKLLIIILSISAIASGLFLAGKTNDSGPKKVEAQTIIQDEEYIRNPDYQDETYQLVLSNDQENFLINGMLVPEEIRVKSGTNLSIEVLNNSDFETSIHFHGINGLSKMDGVGGLTQENIKPEASFTYQFVVDEPGTYMYHSHVDSQNQVNNENLYGGVVIGENDYLNQDMLIYNTNILDPYQHHNANLTYDEVLVNAKNTEEFVVNNDENIYLNVANLSSAPISIYFGDNVKYRITSMDATETTSEWNENVSLIVPTAQRFIVELENPKKSFQIMTTIENVNNAKYNVIYNGEKDFENDYQITSGNYSNSMMDKKSMMGMMGNREFDDLDNNSVHIYEIVESTSNLGIDEKKTTKQFDMKLGMSSGMWVIDDEAFPNTDSLMVQEGDVVEITLKNNSHMSTTHPFHLHGHKFEVIEINGKKVEKNLVMDTVDVMPGTTMKIRLEANNPGIWAFHCHNLNHAALGMMTLFSYEGYGTNVTSGVSE